MIGDNCFDHWSDHYYDQLYGFMIVVKDFIRDWLMFNLKSLKINFFWKSFITFVQVAENLSKPQNFWFSIALHGWYMVSYNASLYVN